MLPRNSDLILARELLDTLCNFIYLIINKKSSPKTDIFLYELKKYVWIWVHIDRHVGFWLAVSVKKIREIDKGAINIRCQYHQQGWRPLELRHRNSIVLFPILILDRRFSRTVFLSTRNSCIREILHEIAYILLLKKQ